MVSLLDCRLQPVSPWVVGPRFWMHLSRSRMKWILHWLSGVHVERAFVGHALWILTARTLWPVYAALTEKVARTPRSTLFPTVSICAFIMQYRQLDGSSSVCCEGPRTRSDAVLQTIQVYPALATERQPPCTRAPPVHRRPQEVGWSVWVHSLRLLLDLLPFILVEPGWISRPCDSHASVQVDCWFPSE